MPPRDTHPAAVEVVASTITRPPEGDPDADDNAIAAGTETDGYLIRYVNGAGEPLEDHTSYATTRLDEARATAHAMDRHPLFGQVKVIVLGEEE